MNTERLPPLNSLKAFDAAGRHSMRDCLRAGSGRSRGSGAVLVTGGAGYVGSHIVLALRDAGYPVAVVDDLSTGDRDAVPAGVPLVRADAACGDAIRGAIARYGVTAAVHAAAALDDAPESATRNRRMCASFVGACAGSGVRRLVLTSSAAVYGAGPASAIAESRAPAPARPYGVGKLACEAAVREGFGAPGLGYVILRCFNVAGADAAGRAGPRAGKALVKTACETALGARGRLTIFGTMSEWECDYSI